MHHFGIVNSVVYDSLEQVEGKRLLFLATALQTHRFL